MIAVIGAGGRSGSALCRALAEAGTDYLPLVLNLPKWQAYGLPGAVRVVDLKHDAPALRDALAGATQVVSCAHASFTPGILAAAPPGASFVLMGSTRRYSRFLDDHGRSVQAGEEALLASGRRGVMLHPTMIYGAPGERNVQRLAAMVRRLPVAPLPGGGRALVQPIHQSDVTRCLVAALARDWAQPQAIVIAGPRATRYRDFVAAVARAAGARAPLVLPVPGGLLRALLPLARRIGALRGVTDDELLRLMEDKDFDIAPMRRELGVDPLPLGQGLALTFAPHTS